MLVASGVYAADFCRVVTFDSWTTVDDKGVQKVDLKENFTTEIYSTMGDRLFYVAVNPQMPTQTFLFTYIGKMNDAHSVTTNDGINVNTFMFYPHSEQFTEQDITAPNEELRDKKYTFTTQTIFGHYKSCTIQQRLMMDKQFKDKARNEPWMNE